MTTYDKIGNIAQIYEGEKGLKILMKDIIDVRENFYVLEGGIKFVEILHGFTKFWAKKREKYNIHAKILATKKTKSKWKFNEIKLIPKKYKCPSSFIIYGNKVAIILYENPITIILINSTTITKNYKSYFDMAWDM